MCWWMNIYKNRGKRVKKRVRRCERGAVRFDGDLTFIQL